MKNGYAYMLVFVQGDRRNTVGVFQSEENAMVFLNSIPFVHRRASKYETEYWISFNDLPDCYTAAYHGWEYVISRFSYSACEPEEDIEVSLIELCSLDSVPEKPGTCIDVPTYLDAYSFPNCQIQENVEKREKMVQEAIQYYKKQNRRVARNGLGSEDGEYLMVSDPENPDQMMIAFLLDPETIAQWEKAGSFEAWIKDHGK